MGSAPDVTFAKMVTYLSSDFVLPIAEDSNDAIGVGIMRLLI